MEDFPQNYLRKRYIFNRFPIKFSKTFAFLRDFAKKNAGNYHKNEIKAQKDRVFLRKHQLRAIL